MSSESKKIRYECTMCGACCRWKGDVCITEDELVSIASFLNMSETDFVDQFCRLRANRQGLSIRDHDDGSCAMLEGGKCKINPVKPTQCKGFPNEWNFPGWRDLCQSKEIID